MTRIAFLIGKPLRTGAVLFEVADRLQTLSVTVDVHLTCGPGALPPWVLDAPLVVQRGLARPALASALPLEQAGVRCCNRISATIAVMDRGATLGALALAGAHVPSTTLAATWHDVVEQADAGPLVVKAAAEFSGRGRGVLIAGNGRLPLQPPFDGPYLVQEYIRGDARDYKVYVVGEQVHGLIKWQTPNDDPQVAPFEVHAQMADAARRVGRILQLEIYGVDFVVGDDGPVVVDVNPFPGFRGVPRAAETIVNYLLTL